ncbi:MAG: hypothetical protein LBV51_05760 [Acholeplasmatales bacterium]|jgi:hypothetical protein|nr:hypothetical protein [Acholeplasmatales bacterium]
MAKEKNTKSNSIGMVLGFLSFFGLLFWSIITLLGVFGVSLPGPLPFISLLFLLLTLFWSAWLFVKHKSKGWKILYAIIVVIAILAWVWGSGWLVFWKK